MNPGAIRNNNVLHCEIRFQRLWEAILATAKRSLSRMPQCLRTAKGMLCSSVSSAFRKDHLNRKATLHSSTKSYHKSFSQTIEYSSQWPKKEWKKESSDGYNSPGPSNGFEHKIQWPSPWGFYYTLFTISDFHIGKAKTNNATLILLLTTPKTQVFGSFNFKRANQGKVLSVILVFSSELNRTCRTRLCSLDF